MRIHTRLDYQWSDEANNYVLVSEEGYNYCPENGLALCKGASDDQNAINQQQQQFYSTLQSDYGKQFAAQNNILSALNTALQPVVAAGPSQFGYSTGELNTLNSQAIQGTGQQYQNAQKALQNQQAQQGGGNMMLPSGVASQNAATLAASGANTLSNQLLGVQQSGYQQGNQNYNNAVSALGGVAGMYNPTGYAGQATGAGSSAANESNTIQQANAAASPWNVVGGLVGGGLSALGGGMGLGLAGNILGGISGKKGATGSQTTTFGDGSTYGSSANY